MARLTRAQQQERTRAAVLAAAREEFAEHGYTDAKVDRIAERAELTRGAVYSNFPSKRALYLAVLLDSVDEQSTLPGSPAADRVLNITEALGEFARVWLERLPLTGDTPASGNLRSLSLSGVFEDEPGRTALAQATRLEALLLGLALESGLAHRAGHPRRVRLAELALTLLAGAGQLAETAPGFGDPFDLARACQHLAGLDLADTWDPPHLPYVRPAQQAHENWQPPGQLPDQLTGRQVGFDTDGVVVAVGTSRLEAAEEAIRAAQPGEHTTVAVVTSDPAEIGRLVRLRISDLTACLRRVFGPDAWPGLRLVMDTHTTVAAAIGVQVADDTEAAVRIRAGTVVARADGRGAGHVVASATDPSTTRSGELSR